LSGLVIVQCTPDELLELLECEQMSVEVIIGARLLRDEHPELRERIQQSCRALIEQWLLMHRQ
jgi:hypothetical protein